MKMFRFIAIAAALVAASPAVAQWQTPTHSVPIGQGAGVTGFGNAAPGGVGGVLTSNGAAVDPSFQLPPAFPAVRVVLAGTSTFYVNANSVATNPCGAFTCSPGSNSNNGLSAAAPFQTIQAALAAMAQNYDFNAQTVNLQAADSTYNECVNLPAYLTTSTTDKNVFILGNAADVTKVVVNCTTASSNAFTAVNAPQGWVIKNITAKATNACLFADYHSAIYWDGGDLNACTNADVQAGGPGSFIEFVNHNYTTTGSKGGHVAVTGGAEVAWNGVTGTVVGNPTYSNAFLASTNGGIFEDGTATFAGSFSGPKYLLSGRPLFFSTGTGTTTQNTTQYVGLSSISSTEVNFYSVGLQTKKAVGLYVSTTASPGAGQSYTFTLRLGGGATPLTCTISGNAATGCSDLTHNTNAIVGNNVVDLQVISSATATAAIVSANVTLQ